MRKKVDKAQQSAYLVRVWIKHHSYAPKNRDELVSFVKTLNPNFGCSALVAGDAQNQLKEHFALSTPTIPAQADKDFDEIKNDPIFASVFLFCKDLQNQFEQAHKDSKALSTIFLEHRVHELEQQLEAALKLLDKHGIKYDPAYFKTNGTLDVLEPEPEAQESLSVVTESQPVEQALEVAPEMPEVVEQAPATQDEQAGKSDQPVSTDEVTQDVVLMPEAIEGAKEALDAINEAKAKTKPKRSYHRKTPEEAAAAKAAKEAKAAEREAKKQAKSKSKGTELS